MNVASANDSSRDVSAAALDERASDALAEESLVAFLRGLDRRARADLERLAEADRRHGEDVATELAEATGAPRDGSAS